MDPKQGHGTGSGVATARMYEEFDPQTEWAKEQGFDNLLVYLPGFQKDKIKVQITSSKKLRLSGERPLGQKKWQQFVKELSLSPDYDADKISAKFEGGILYVKVPKAVVSATTTSTTPKASATATSQQQPKEKEKPKPKPTAADQSIPAPQPPPDSHTKRTTPSAADQVPPKPDAASLGKEQSSTETKDRPANSMGKTAVDKQAAAEKAAGTTTTKPEEKPGGVGGSPSSGKSKAGEKLAGDVAGSKTTRLESYKKAITQGNPRTFVNMVLAVLFLGVLALYLKNVWNKSLGQSNGSDHEL